MFELRCQLFPMPLLKYKNLPILKLSCALQSATAICCPVKFLYKLQKA